MSKFVFRIAASVLASCLVLSQAQTGTNDASQISNSFDEQALAAPAINGSKILAGHQRLIGALALAMLAHPALITPQHTAEEPKPLLRQHPVVTDEIHLIEVGVPKAFVKRLEGQLDWEKKIGLELKGRLTPNRIIEALKTRYPEAFPQKTHFVILLTKDGHAKRWDPEEDLPTGPEYEYAIAPAVGGGSDNRSELPFAALAAPRNSPGPGSAGKGLRKIFENMILERNSFGADISMALARTLKAFKVALPEDLRRILDAFGAADLTQTLTEQFPSWLRHQEEKLRPSFGSLISYAVRFALRSNSALSPERQKTILNDAMLWGASVGLRPRFLKTTPEVIIDIPLANGSPVRMMIEAVAHKKSFSTKRRYVDALNLFLGNRDSIALFSVLLEDRACQTPQGTFKTLEHEVWEVSLRALGYPAAMAHRMTVVYANQKTPLVFLLNLRAYESPITTSGPSAGGSLDSTDSTFPNDSSISSLVTSLGSRMEQAEMERAELFRTALRPLQDGRLSVERVREMKTAA